MTQPRKHCKQWKLNCDLVYCEGENLPFKDETFDVLFDCGGINYFNDKQQVILEMIRVANPGSRLMVVDETDKLIRENYQINPFLRNHFNDVSKANIPVNLVPIGMKEIKSEIISKGLMHRITFMKPGDDIKLKPF